MQILYSLKSHSEHSHEEWALSIAGSDLVIFVHREERQKYGIQRCGAIALVFQKGGGEPSGPHR